MKKFYRFLCCLLLSFFCVSLHAYQNFDRDLQEFYLNYSGSNNTNLGNYFVPSNDTLVENQWLNKTESIRCQIGNILPTPSFTELLWKNSANSVGELYTDAVENSIGFMEKLREIASKISGSKASFGPNDAFVVKSKESLERKAESKLDKGQVDPHERIGDALRATMVVQNPSDHSSMIDSLKAEFNKVAGVNNIVFDNKFNYQLNNIGSGYVGVHGALNWKNETTGKNIIAEVQEHFSNIMDGTLDCPKEYSHGVYNITRLLKRPLQTEIFS